jgi:stage II sporulation protein D
MSHRRTFFLISVIWFFCLGLDVQAGGTSISVLENPEPTIRVKVSGRRGRILEIPLETYLAGVIGHEMSPRWPLEALKAQTIAARSYALSRMEAARDKGRHYDVVDSQGDQVFRANRDKSGFLKGIVEQTRGQVLMTNGQIVQAYFSSTCGGRMETAAGAKLAQTDLLTKAGKDSFCTISPFRQWTVSSSLFEIENRLERRGYGVNGLESLKVKKRNKSGYVNAVAYQDLDGHHTIGGRDFRYVMGSYNVKSQLFTIYTHSDKSVTIKGNGFGHGVGLCQYGAKAMALKGYGYKRILAKYYPRISIKTIY